MTLSNRCFHGLFELQATLSPNKRAIACNSRALTYSELNTRANQLAHYLRAAGVGPETLVGIYTERTPEFVVAILGVLKAGGAYLPFDPAYPKERLASMLQNAGKPIVLTEEHLRGEVAEYSQRTIPLDSDWPLVAQHSEANPEQRVSPDQLANVHYTSGSTGLPKGVMLTQGNLLHAVSALQAELGITPNDVYLCSASFAFSSSRRQLMLPLSQGAAVVIATDDQRKDPLAFCALIGREGVTVIDVVPSFLRHCTTVLSGLEAEAKRKLLDKRLRLILTASESLLSDVPRSWMREFRHPAQHVHMYGITETSGILSVYRIPDNLDSSVVPIGRPLANTEFFLLGPDSKPVSDGEPGEIYVASAAVARGFLGDPALTDQKFIYHPSKPGVVLFKTGDWGRRLPDGGYTHLGRQDQQVKIRGFRVELQQIEAALLQCPGLKDAAVIAREDVPGEPRLVAYVVTEQPEGKIDEIRRFLSTKLPDYMLPSYFMVLDRLPLVPAGKIDRAALPVPNYNASAALWRTARTPQEEILCDLFAEVLRIDRVGIDDNFFELGGHSLIGTQLASRIRATLGVEMALRTLFESPTVRQLSPLLGDTRANPVPLEKQTRPRHMPLSHPQRRLWFVDRLQESSVEYNRPKALRLRGALDRKALNNAINTIVERHESLRTHFAEIDGEPVQVIEPPQAMEIPLEDLSGLDEVAQRERVLAVLRNEWDQPFDLARGPVWRVKLLKLGDQEHILVRNLHHIVTDFWSEGLFHREFTTLYDAYHEGRKNPLPPLPVQYADFALWQRKCSDLGLPEGVAYWKRQLAGMPKRLELPTDRPRPATQTFEAGEYRTFLPTDQLAGLKSLARKNQATLYMTLLAAFGVLLARYSGQDDIVVGSPIANRQEAQLEELIGLFVNTLLMRLGVRHDLSFQELLKEVRRTALEAYQHQNVPFESLVEELSPHRGLDATPLFQVMFALQNAPIDRKELKGLLAEPQLEDELRVRFDLEVYATEQEGGLALSWLFKRMLFDTWRIEQMARHYMRILEAVAANSNQPVGQIDILNSEDRRLLEVWNAQASTVPESTLPRLFEEQVERTPDRAAARWGDQQLSYRDLNERSNQLAHYLRELGVGPETLVGVCLERGPDLLIALLGVLKAGGAYLPLDPEYPAQRLSYIAQDAKLSLVLSYARFRGRIPADRVVCLDDAWPRRDSAPNPVSSITPETAAYVIYTSGSTGQPKGIVATHRATVNRLAWMWNRYPFDAHDVCCAKTSLNFVDSVSEIFGPLLKGVPLIFVSDDDVKDVRRLLEIIQAYRITRIVVVPSLLRELLWMLPLCNTEPSSLRMVITSGEALPRDVAREFGKTMPPDTLLVNLYGSSEVAGDVTYFEVTVKEDREGPIPIGRAISNTQIYIVDQTLNLVPVGVPGELLVGGLNVARGYWNRPELTAQRFIANPFSSQDSGRLYRTGDLARWLPDGNIEYLGRSDHQVKVRGFRIELGEIEAALRSHPRVQDAVVIVRGEDEEKRLLGYVTPRDVAADQAWTSHLQGWEQVWTSTYRDGNEWPADFNIAGWNSSYTGAPIPAEEMRLWVEETVHRLRELKPTSVLEIGCGTGLLLTRLAGGSKRYVGLDFSAQVLGQLGAYLAERKDLSHVELQQGLAHDLSFLSDDSVDLVILNSVVQYFPHVDYLLDVLDEALRVTRPGGHIFVGDVRSLPLLEAYQTSIQLFKASPELPVAELRQRIARELRNEAELVLDPVLFEELGRRKHKLGRVQTWLKTGFDNELSQFRYDALMKVGDRETLVTPERWLTWDPAGAWRKDLKEALAREPQSSIGVRGIRDCRVAAAVQVVHLLRADEVREVRHLRAARGDATGEDPAAVVQLARTLEVEFCWQRNGSEGLYDTVFNPQWQNEATLADLPKAYYQRLGNAPARSDVDKNLGQLLRDYLAQSLPDYMVPTSIVALEAFPLTPNGKLDRKALPAPDFNGATVSRTPQTREEQILCGLFAEFLRVERVGTDDNFFELGGHSLLAAKLLFRAEREFGVRLSLASIFLAPTVQQLAVTLRQGYSDGTMASALPVIPFQPHGDGIPLFWINPGYEGARLARHFGKDHPLFGIPIPPAQDPAAQRSIDQMATECTSVLRRFRPEGPYALAGWCASGVIALEMARQLEQQGCEVSFVAMLDLRSVFLPPLSAPHLAWARFWRRARRLVYVARRWPKSLWSRFQNATLGRPLEPLAEHVQAMLRYHPLPWAGRMVHIWASDWPHGRYFSPAFGWNHLAPNGFVFHEVPSDHLTLIQEPAVGSVARILTGELDRAQHAQRQAVVRASAPLPAQTLLDSEATSSR